jgi:hypothetical protein
MLVFVDETHHPDGTFSYCTVPYLQYFQYFSILPYSNAAPRQFMPSTHHAIHVRPRLLTLGPIPILRHRTVTLDFWI